MDENLLLLINQQWHSPLLDTFFAWVSEKNTFSFPLLLAIILGLGWRWGKTGWILGLMMIIVAATSDLLGNTLKSLFAQPRPCLHLWDQIRMPHAESTRCMTSTSGMPSNHALNFFATFSFLSFILQRHTFTLITMTVCVLVALSRVYLGEHFPSQAISGAIIGAGYGLLLAKLVKHYFNHLLPKF